MRAVKRFESVYDGIGPYCINIVGLKYRGKDNFLSSTDLRTVWLLAYPYGRT